MKSKIQKYSKKNSSRKNSSRKNSSRKNKINKLKGGVKVSTDRYNEDLIEKIKNNSTDITILEPKGEFYEDFENGNWIPKTFTIFADALSINKSIKKLILRNLLVKLGHILVDALLDNKTLNILSFQHMYANTAQLFADLISNNKTINTLIINYCEIDEEADNYIENFLGPALIVNNTLQTLDISHNGISYPEIIQLCLALQRNRTLTTLNICNGDHDSEEDFDERNFDNEEFKNIIINGKRSLKTLKNIIDRNRDNVLKTNLFLDCNHEDFIGKHLENLQKLFPEVDHIREFVNKEFKDKFRTTQTCINRQGLAFKNGLSNRKLGTFSEIIKKEYHPKGLIYDQIP